MIREKKFLKRRFEDDKLIIDSKFKARLKTKLFESEKTIMAKTPTELNIKQLMNQRTFRVAGMAVLILLASTVLYANNNRTQSLARQEVIKEAVELPQNLGNVLGLDEMRTLAEKDTPAGATIVKVEIENEHGVVLYKVKFSDGTYRLYDATTGLAYVEVSSGLETDESVPSGFVAGITVQQARDTASAQRPGKVITKIELEMEEGKVVYSVRFSDNGRVDIDASNGSVVRVRTADESNSSDDSSDDTNEDSDDSIDSEDHEEEDIEDDGDRSGDDNSDSDEDEEDN